MGCSKKNPRNDNGRRRWPAVLGFALVLTAGSALSLTGIAPAQDLQTQLGAVQSKQDSLQGSIQADNKKVDDLMGQVASLQQRESAAQDQLDAKQAELDKAQAALDKQRKKLAVLRARLKRALGVLKQRLVEIYKSGNPDVLTVILSSASWSDVMAEGDYLDRLQQNDNVIVDRVKTLKSQTQDAVDKLTADRNQIASARDAIANQRDQLASAESSVSSERDQLIAARNARKKQLGGLLARQKKLSKKLAAQGQAPTVGSAPITNGPHATLGADGQATAPASAPAAVRSAIAAANSIATTPYVWGGGHGSFTSSGYDCSGAVSFMLHGGGLLSSPLDSTGLATWGSPGPGRWITVYANASHAWAVVAGLRWDTVGDASGTGPRWHTDMESTAGFIARHPPGL